MKVIFGTFALILAFIGGYLYGYGAYNRPIKRWEIWKK